MKRRVLSFLALGIAIAAAAVACENGLNPSYVLDSPRVLAIRTSPVYMLPDASVTLDALLYAPAGSPPPVYSWSWCANVNATLQCATTAAELLALLDPTDSGAVTVDYDLGANASAIFPYPASPDVIRAACSRRIVDGGVVADDASDVTDASDASDVTDASDAGDASAEGGAGPGALLCTGSTLTLYAMLTVTVGDKTMQAVREVTLYLDTPSETNANPTVLGLAPFTLISEVPSEAGALFDPSLTIADGGDASISSDAGIGLGTDGYVLGAYVPVSASELTTPSFGGFGGPSDMGTDAGDASAEAGTYESLSLAWFVEQGTLDRATTTLPNARYGAPRDLQAFLTNHWVPPANAGAVQVILVVRDGRGGVGWKTMTVTP